MQNWITFTPTVQTAWHVLVSNRHLEGWFIMAKVKVEMLHLNSFHGYVGIGFAPSNIPFIGFKLVYLIY